MSRVRRLLAGIGAAVAVTAPAAEPPEPPLATTREQLRALPKDGAAGPDQRPPGDWRVGWPQVTAPPPVRPADGPPVARPTPDRREVPPTRNWLRDGMARTEREAAGGRGAGARASAGQPGEGAAAGDDEPLDPADPDFLVKAEDQRRRRTERAEARRAAGRIDAAAQLPANPLAPLMLEWLARSPVRGLAEATLRSEQAAARGAPVAAAVGLPGRAEPDLPGRHAAGAGASGASGTGGRAARAENPYLAALAWPVAAGAGADPGTSSEPRPGSGANSGAKEQGVALPAAGPAAAGRKPPRAPWEDDRKFFPQAKKF